jgi:hypothetical protein
MTDISQLTLITRACMCGCKESFRCLSTSPQRYAAAWHDRLGTRFDRHALDYSSYTKYKADYQKRNREIYESRLRGLEIIELVKGRAA